MTFLLAIEAVNLNVFLPGLLVGFCGGSESFIFSLRRTRFSYSRVAA
jgi:hypothetical protein